MPHFPKNPPPIGAPPKAAQPSTSLTQESPAQAWKRVVNDWTDGAFVPLPVTAPPGGSVPTVRR